MSTFVRGYLRKSKLGKVIGVASHQRASGPHSKLLGMSDMRASSPRLGGKALTRSEVKAAAKAGLARARQIQKVRLEAISLRPNKG